MPLILDIDWAFFDRVYFGEKVAGYLWFVGIVLGTLILKKPMASVLTRLSSMLTARYSYIEHKGAIREMLFKPIERLLQIVFYFVAVNQLDDLLEKAAVHHIIGSAKKVDIKVGQVLDHIFLLLFIIFLTQFITRLVDFIYYMRMDKAHKEKNHSQIQLLPLVKEMAKLILWIMSAFWIMGSVFHVNVPALITGLGIGGVAIALAGKETVENFFAAFTILSDKPFQTGDAIKLGEIEAVVERIGFRSTRLRNLDGSAYIIPNQNLVSQNLINLSMRNFRGMKVVANIKYGISHATLVLLTAELKEALVKIAPIREPITVNLETMDKETFQLIISYNLPHPLPEEIKLIDIKRDANLKIFEVISAHATLGTAVGTSG